MSQLFIRCMTFTIAVSACFFAAEVATAQLPNNNNQNPNGVTVQLPTISVFNVNTVVSVPDGGTASLGGVSRYSSGSTSRGVPGLSSIPFVNRPFRNRGYGYDSSASNASVNVQIISLAEQEALVLERARMLDALDMAQRRTTDPNGSAAVQKKADFLSRHMGRSSR